MPRYQTNFLTLLLVSTTLIYNTVIARTSTDVEFINNKCIANVDAIDSVMPIRSFSKDVALNSAYFGGNATLIHLFKSAKPTKASLGFTKNGMPVEAYFFPGKTTKKSLVIGGMHGSELASIEIAYTLIASLQKGKVPDYSVIIIPCLFPDNAQTAITQPELIGSVHNIGRYTHSSAPDPNRQMPSLGKPFLSDDAKDHLGREIERENQLLLHIIAAYRPERIVNIHAIRNATQAGIYADPRTDSKGRALGFKKDSLLAINMAKYIDADGGCVAGNQLHVHPTARYPKDPHIVSLNAVQPRSTCGASLTGNKGCGVSLGSWATTAVEDEDHPEHNRDAITLITIEYPGYKRSIDYKTDADKIWNKRQISLFAKSIEQVFLKERN